jgi:hypothetical protein
MIVSWVDFFLSRQKYDVEKLFHQEYNKFKGLYDLCNSGQVDWLFRYKNLKDCYGVNSIFFAGIIFYLKKESDIL